VGWEGAHFGDPIEDLVGMAVGPEPAVQAIRSHVDALDAAGHRRLEAYIALELLARLARGSTVELGRQVVQVRMQWAAIEDGLAGRSALPLPQPVDILTQQLLLGLRLATPERIDADIGRIAAALWAADVARGVDMELLGLANQVHLDWLDEPSTPKSTAATALTSTSSMRARALWYVAQQAEARGYRVPWQSIADLARPLELFDARWSDQLADQGKKARAGHEVLRGIFTAVSRQDDADTGLKAAQAAAGVIGQGQLLLEGYENDPRTTVERLAGARFEEPYQWLVFAVLHALHTLGPDRTRFVVADSVPGWFGIGH
jgi:hypothetical protein